MSFYSWGPFKSIIMKYTYEDCLEQTLKYIKEYNTMRNNRDEWDKWRFQDIRDELGEALVFFGPFLADIRTAAETAELERKEIEAISRGKWTRHYKSARGTAALVAEEVMKECKNASLAEIKANNAYYKARELRERVDQVLNGIASRLKILEKYDKEG